MAHKQVRTYGHKPGLGHSGMQFLYNKGKYHIKVKFYYTLLIPWTIKKTIWGV